MPVTQQTLTPLVEYKAVKGIDNLTTDPMRLSPGYVRIANNVDIDDERMMHRRDGVLRAILSGSWKSLWSKDDLCFGVKSGVLTKINVDWTETTILSAVGTSRMNYVPIDDRVFFSNLSVVGYIKDGVAYGFPEPDRQLRQKMVGGEILEYYEGRLYAVQGNNVFFSIAYSPMEMDSEKNFIQLNGPISMFNAVSDGIWVSEKDGISFHQGPDLFNMIYKKMLNEPAIKGSAITIDGIDLASGASSKCVVFSTEIGIYMGFTGGVLKNVTDGKYGVLDIEQGQAIISSQNGYYQYIFMAQAPAGIGTVTLNVSDPADTASITLS
jgi:hypothetical protein